MEIQPLYIIVLYSSYYNVLFNLDIFIDLYFFFIFLNDRNPICIYIKRVIFYFRELKHENIISYYGCTLQQTGQTTSKVHWIMIMELCDQTLKSKFLDSDYDNPAKVGSIHSLQIKQMGELARYAMQICSGLGYLHKKELVHRDIKLENILVNQYLNFISYNITCTILCSMLYSNKLMTYLF